ncbi:MAG: CBS domain-containing protein [Crocosphaera sp.]|nr:CBS domain-containing protein [Crocosphaera sp.]
MNPNQPLISLPALEGVIDYHPLIVSPDTLVVEAIALMSQARGKRCLLQEEDSLTQMTHHSSDGSCVLVMDKQQLLGMFTERDIVRLTATRTSLAQVPIAEVMATPVITLKQVHFQDIFAALFLFRRYRIRHLPIVDDSDRLIGVVSPETIRQALKPANLLKFRRVSDVMSKEVVDAPVTASILHLAQLMATGRVSCVVITETDTDERIKPVGIVTERDIVQFQSLELNLSRIQALDVMSTPLFLLSPEDSLWIAHQEMLHRRVRRLVVSWNWGRGLGIVTQTSLLRVFDPMEMYSVIETLQRTAQPLSDLQGKRDEKTNQPNNKPNYQDTPQELNRLLLRLEKSLEYLVNEPELDTQTRTNQLQQLLADVILLKNL